MAWERMWADLSAQAEQWERDASVLDAADRLRVEQAAIGWLDRLRAATDRPLTVRLPSGRRVRGQVLACGADWFALRGDSADVLVVPAGAALAVAGLGSAVVPSEALGAVARGADLRLVLRRVAASGEQVVVGGIDGTDVRGVIDRVGRDHLDVRVEGGPDWTLPLPALERLGLD